MGRFCPLCNFNNLTTHNYCTQCGTKLTDKSINSPHLVVLNIEGESVVCPLTEAQSTVGRDTTNTVSINDDQISKKHALIYTKDNDYWISDLNSRNGIYINGEKIEQDKKLYNSVLIKLGATILRFEKE